MMVFGGLSVVAEPADPVGERAVVRDDRAAVSAGSQVLGRIETERGDLAERPDLAARVARSDRLRAVLDQEQVVTAGDRAECGHVRRLSIEMDRENRSRLRGHRGLGRARVDGEGERIDVDQHRPRAAPLDRADRGNGGVRHGDDFVTRADSGGPDRQLDRVGAIGDAHRVPGSDPGGECLLERLDFRAENVPARLDHPARRVEDLVPHLADDEAEVVEGNRHRILVLARIIGIERHACRRDACRAARVVDFRECCEYSDVVDGVRATRSCCRSPRPNDVFDRSLRP